VTSRPEVASCHPGYLGELVMGNGLASACIYRERSSRYGKNINQRSSYTPYHAIILTDYETRLNAQPIHNVIHTHASLPSCLAILQSFVPRNIEYTKFTCKHGSIEILNDHNYHSWKPSLKAFLIVEEAFGIVTGTQAPRTPVQPLSYVTFTPAPDGPTR